MFVFCATHLHSEHTQNTCLIRVFNLELQKVSYVVVSIQKICLSCFCRKPRLNKRWLFWSFQASEARFFHLINWEVMTETFRPLTQFRIVLQQEVALWSYTLPEIFIFLRFGLYEHAGCFSIWLMSTAVWYLVGVHKLQFYIITRCHLEATLPLHFFTTVSWANSLWAPLIILWYDISRIW